MGSVKLIVIDAMGGNGGAGVIVPAAVKALLKFPDVLLTLVGNKVAAIIQAN